MVTFMSHSSPQRLNLNRGVRAPDVPFGSGSQCVKPGCLWTSCVVRTAAGAGSEDLLLETTPPAEPREPGDCKAGVTAETKAEPGTKTDTPSMAVTLYAVVVLCVSRAPRQAAPVTESRMLGVVVLGVPLARQAGQKGI